MTAITAIRTTATAQNATAQNATATLSASAAPGNQATRTTAPTTLAEARPDLVNAHTSERRVPEGTEVRGFALYVGLTDDKIAEGDPKLGEIVSQIKQLVAQLAPAAGTYAAVALAPEGTGGRDVDVVRLALGDPAAIADRHKLLVHHSRSTASDTPCPTLEKVPREELQSIAARVEALGIPCSVA